MRLGIHGWMGRNGKSRKIGISQVFFFFFFLFSFFLLFVALIIIEKNNNGGNFVWSVEGLKLDVLRVTEDLPAVEVWSGKKKGMSYLLCLLRCNSWNFCLSEVEELQAQGLKDVQIIRQNVEVLTWGLPRKSRFVLRWLGVSRRPLR